VTRAAATAGGTAAAGAAVRRLAAELTGTGLLVAIVVGAGISAIRLTADGALRLLANSLATAIGLAVLIAVRPIRDAIGERVQALLSDLDRGAGHPGRQA
jgi:hypothetical protein